MQETVQYTVWDRGRLLGHTDLGFRRVIRGARVGWFHPTAAGERIMPLVSAVPAAMRAIVRGGVLAEDDAVLAATPEDRATLFADLAEALQHVQALELELRREDGSLVPVTDIGLQDTGLLVQMAHAEGFEPLDEVDWECDDGDFSIGVFDPDDPESVGNLRELEDLDGLDDLDDVDDVDDLDDLRGELPWAPDAGEDPPMERYQVIVQLVDDGSIP